MSARHPTRPVRQRNAESGIDGIEEREVLLALANDAGEGEVSDLFDQDARRSGAAVVARRPDAWGVDDAVQSRLKTLEALVRDFVLGCPGYPRLGPWLELGLEIVGVWQDRPVRARAAGLIQLLLKD